MSTLNQFLGGGGIKSIQRGSTEFAGTSASNITTITVPINPVVRSKSVVISSVAGDAKIVTFLTNSRDPSSFNSVVINSTAGISLGGNPSNTTASSLIIVVGKGILVGGSLQTYNQSGIIGWQVIEYE